MSIGKRTGNESRGSKESGGLIRGHLGEGEVRVVRGNERRGSMGNKGRGLRVN